MFFRRREIELGTAVRACVAVLAFVLQPSPVLAQQGEEESSYFGPARELPTAAGQVWSVALSPDGKTLAVASGMPDKPGALSIWDVPAKNIRARVYDQLGIRAVHFSPDGKTLAT